MTVCPPKIGVVRCPSLRKFGYDFTSRGDRNLPARAAGRAEKYTGDWPSLKYWLEHFTHPSPNFYRGCGDKVKNVAWIFDPRCLWGNLVSKTSQFWNVKCAFGAPVIGACSLQIWFGSLPNSKKSRPRKEKRAGKISLIISHSVADRYTALKFGAWVRCGSAEVAEWICKHVYHRSRN